MNPTNHFTPFHFLKLHYANELVLKWNRLRVAIAITILQVIDWIIIPYNFERVIIEGQALTACKAYGHSNCH